MTPDGKLRKKDRLLRPGEFRSVYRKGGAVRQGALTLCYLKGSADESRIGFSISAKNVKRATSRNRIRRIFREAYRRNKKAIKGSFDMVLVVRGDISESFGYIQAEEALMKLSSRAGMLA